MSKAILISDHAKWCALMMNGKKRIEVRKNKALANAIQKLIDKYGYAEIYVYCTKDKRNLLHKNCANIYWVEDKEFQNKNKELGVETQPILNGKVLFKFRCYNVEEIKFHCLTKSNTYGVRRIETTFTTQTLSFTELKELSCLTGDDLMKYLNDADGYAIHISDLEIFDEPKELSEFYKSQCPLICMHKNTYYCNICSNRLTKAPQSWCYVEDSL